MLDLPDIPIRMARGLWATEAVNQGLPSLRAIMRLPVDTERPKIARHVRLKGPPGWVALVIPNRFSATLVFYRNHVGVSYWPNTVEVLTSDFGIDEVYKYVYNGLESCGTLASMSSTIISIGDRTAMITCSCKGLDDILYSNG